MVPLSENVTVGRTRRLRREIVSRDEDGKITGRRTSVVHYPALPGDEAQPVRVTIKAVREVDVSSDLTLVMVKNCGYRTTDLLLEAWKSRHPRTGLARYVEFELGDTRDNPRFLNPTGAGGGDYTGNRHKAIDENEALGEGDLNQLLARQKGVKKVIDKQRELSQLSLAERAARLEAANDPQAWRSEKWGIEQRLDRAEKQVGALAR